MRKDWEQQLEEPTLSVQQLVERHSQELELELLAGRAGLSTHRIRSPRIQKPGLALSGYIEYIRDGRVQILGESEITFLKTLSNNKRKKVIQDLCERGLTCILVTKRLEPPKELCDLAETHQIPLLRTSLISSRAIDRLTHVLNRDLASTITIHAILMDIYGLGILLLGDSGIGKSECGLDLIDRGHRLVSDDAVIIKKTDIEELIGSGPDLTRHRMELRGLGIINIKDLYGVASIRSNKRIDMVITLDEWDETSTYDRLGLDEETYELLGVEVPHIRMPVAPGRNLSILIEIAARNYLLKLKGYQPARELALEMERRQTDAGADASPSTEEGSS